MYPFQNADVLVECLSEGDAFFKLIRTLPLRHVEKRTASNDGLGL